MLTPLLLHEHCVRQPGLIDVEDAVPLVKQVNQAQCKLLPQHQVLLRVGVERDALDSLPLEAHLDSEDFANSVVGDNEAVIGADCMLDLGRLVHDAVFVQEPPGLGHDLAVHSLLGLLVVNEITEELLVPLGLGDERLGKCLRDPMQSGSIVEGPVVYNYCVHDGDLLLDSELVRAPLRVLVSREVTLEDDRLETSTWSLQLASIAPAQQHLSRLPHDVDGLRLTLCPVVHGFASLKEL
jgi:hypothetical protein